MQNFRKRMYWDKETNLWTLDLRGIDNQSLEFLNTMPEVQVLYLSFSDIMSLADLPKLPNLQELDLTNTQIRSLDGLESVPKLQRLNLSGTEVTSLEGLENVPYLQRLDLSVMQIESLNGLVNVPNLQELDLTETQIRSLEGLKSVPKLQRLDLHGTQIASLECLESVPNLQELNLTNTQIRSLDGLESVPKLQRLNLGGTEVTSLEGLENVPNLQRLDLWRTKIESLDGLENVPNLIELDLGYTQLASLEGIPSLPNLESLDLCHSQFASLEGIEVFPNLKNLYLLNVAIKSLKGLENALNLRCLDLSETAITSIPSWLGNIQRLQGLDLSNLHLNSIPKDLLQIDRPFVFEEYFSRNSVGINLFNTTIATQPISLFEQPREFIEAYYEAEQVPVKESKVIFLGDGGAGKSYTIAGIERGVLPKNFDTKATPGVNITRYPTTDKNGNDFTINFWDFGGQEIMHTMHRCFLTERTCYVVVVNNRTSDMTRSVRYWLKSIDSFAKDAPVIIAINKWDGIKDMPIDTTRLYAEYKNIVAIVSYNAHKTQDSEFKLLVEKIIDHAGVMDSCSMSLPRQWANIREELLKCAESKPYKPYISMEDYYKICYKNGLREEHGQIRTWLLEWFNDLGVCFSYHKDQDDMTKLAEYKVLDPKWLTNAVYKLVNCDKDRFVENGRININQLDDILKETKACVIKNITYESEDCKYILEVMRKFSLSYSINDKFEFVPALCNNESPENLYPNDMEKSFSYEMRYTYLPVSVVHRLMIKCFKLIDDEDGEMVWRKGMRLEDYISEAKAVIGICGDDTVLRIDIYEKDNKPAGAFVHKLRKDIMDINRELGIEAQDFIIKHENGESVEFSVDFLIAAKDAKDEKVPYYNRKLGYKHYEVNEFLGMTFGNENMQKAEAYARENNTSMVQAIYHITNYNTYNNSNNTTNTTINYQPSGEEILKIFLEKQWETNQKLTDFLIETFKANQDKDVKILGEELEKDRKEKKSLGKRLGDFVGNVATGTKNAQVIGQALFGCWTAIQTHWPEISGFFQNLIGK